MNEIIESKQYIVIGSGPAGVSAAKALLNRQVAVLMLDAGIQLDQNRNNTLNQLQFQWDEKLYASLKHKIDVKNQLKLSYGSNYPYQDVDKHIRIIANKNIRCSPSFARGGLSTVWGAHVDQYNANDMQQWPITPTELNPYYQLISGILPTTHHFQQSEQAKILLQHMQKHVAPLNEAGFSFKKPELAAYFNGTQKRNACFYCGNCQHGCPNKLIYSANDTLQELLLYDHFSYLSGIVVEKIIETKNDITVVAHELNNTNKKISFHGRKVFLAAGVISSTQILLNTLNLFEHSVFLKDSQHFILPCLMKRASKGAEKEKLHTLTQLSIQIRNEAISRNSVHLQIYTYMDHYQTQLKKMLKFAYPFLKPILGHFLNRLFIIQGYFHSDESTVCKMKLSHDQQSIFIQQEKNGSNARHKLNKLMLYLFKKHHLLGFFPLPIMTQFSKSLSANHYGGSFPMQNSPRTTTTTDLLGRPNGMQNLHVVDATVFPTIPAQSITFTVMANAYRIATECPL